MKRMLKIDVKDIENNVYYKDNPDNFRQLKDIIENNPKNYCHQLSSKNYQNLTEWINSILPQLSDPFFKLSTKCVWIFNNITEFPHCKNDQCQKVLNDRNVSIRHGYGDFCSAVCSNKSIQTKQKISDAMSKWTIEKLAARANKSRSTRYAKYDGKWESLETKARRRKTNILHCGYAYNLSSLEFRKSLKTHNLEQYGVEYTTQRQDVKDKIQHTKLERYGNLCGSYEKTKNHFTSEIYEKSKQTCLRRYGVANGGASDIAQQKMKRRYMYDNVDFDSAPELAMYIWLKDNNIKFTYHDGAYFEYIFNNVTYRYYPDFYLPEIDSYIEIKGDHFFENDGSMQCPFKDKSNVKRHLMLSAKYEAKHQCMLKNNVIILRNAQYEYFLFYVNAIYGKDYLHSFRKSKLQNCNI